MDPLSDILSMLKPRSTITAGFDAGGAWCLRLDDLAGRIKCYAVMRGSCWLSPEDGSAPVEVTAGDCFVLPSGRPVRIGSDPALPPRPAGTTLSPDRDGGTVVHNGGGDVFLTGSRFDVRGRHAEVLLRTLPAVVHLKAAADQAALRWSIHMMTEELRERRPASSLIAQHLAQMMLAQALRLHLSEHTGAGAGWFAGLSDPPIGLAIGAMHADPAHDWTVAELAARVAMSRTAFARRFRDRSGETPIAYLTRWRMMLAAEKLSAGREPLANIALSVGYESENAFSTAFARVMGTPPRRYAERTDRDGKSASTLRRSRGKT